jgi:hypothetical protein
MKPTTNQSSPHLPFSDAAPAWPPADWRASWIWTQETTTGTHDYVYFRREFPLQSVPGQVLLHIAAERDATLWINGELIAHGPPISDPRFKRYETHDITAWLKPGTNCVAVRVYHDQKHAGFTAHADARGLLCQVEAGGNVIVATDADWRAELCQAYGKPGVVMGDSMWPEIFNATLDTPGWQLAGFDDSSWRSARLVIAPKHHLWGSEQPQARFFPWVNLIPCETRPLLRTRHRPAAVLAVGEVLQQREASAHDVAVRMSLETIEPLNKAAVVNAEALPAGAGGVRIHNSPLTESDDTFDGLHNATIVLDFGKLMNARFGFRLKTDAAAVDIGYAYRLDQGRVSPYVSCRTAIADFYLARPGDQSWESADWRHFRYVQITFRNLPGELVLEEVWAEEIRNHFEPRGAFACSDPVVERLFDIHRRTTWLSIIDRTMDNPSRERKQYLGDCSSIVPAITSCFGDAALLRRYFTQTAEGQHATGEYRYSYPGHDNDLGSLFDHALSLPLRLWEHHQLFADRALVRNMWPGIVRLLDLAASCLDADDMMTLPPYNIWFDWGHMDRRGHFLPLQAMTAEVLRCSAALAGAIGESPEPWAGLASRMAAQIPRWFDADRGVFVDAIVGGQRQPHFSEHGNSLVAMWNLAPAPMIQSALDRWAEDPLAFGQTSPAWMYLPAAFLRAGRPELAIRWLHRRLGQLDQQGLDTWPETWCLLGERTIGTWRCRNSRAVAQGAGLGATTALLQDLCGIQPAEPGFAAVRIAPRPGPLTSLSGTQPGPDGNYSITLEKREGEWLLQLSLPSPRRVILETAFAPAAREVLVDGAPLLAQESVILPNGSEAGRFVWNAGMLSEVRVAT